MSQTDAWPWTCARIYDFIQGRTKFELDIEVSVDMWSKVDFGDVGRLRHSVRSCLHDGLDDHIEDVVWEAVLIDD